VRIQFWTELQLRFPSGSIVTITFKVVLHPVLVFSHDTTDPVGLIVEIDRPAVDVTLVHAMLNFCDSAKIIVEVTASGDRSVWIPMFGFAYCSIRPEMNKCGMARRLPLF